MYMNVRSTAALSVISPNWKQPKGPATGKWLNKPWHIHTMYETPYYETPLSNKME